MSNGDVSIINDHDSTDNLSHIDQNPHISIKLQYKDRRENLEERLNKAQCPCTTTIREVIEEFLKVINLEHVPAESIKLIDITNNTKHYDVPLENTHMKLNELDIVDGCTLCFERLHTPVIEEPSFLSIYGIKSPGSLEYKWYKNTTTLGTLLEYVVEIFSSESIPRERIHLFYFCEELDVGLNYDKLLKDLGIRDTASIDVEIIPPILRHTSFMNTSASNGYFSSSNGQSSTTYSPNIELDSTILLHLKYTDHYQDIDKTVQDRFSPTNTIQDVAEKLVKLAHLDSLRPVDITLIEYGLFIHRKTFSGDSYKTLKQLDILHGYTLYFGPASTSILTKPYTMTIRLLDNYKEVKYEWNRYTTTFDMLLDYVIEKFALQSIERKCIRLITCWDKELQCTLHSSRLLSDLCITDNDWIRLKIIRTDLSSTSNERPNVHVKCFSNIDVKEFNIPYTITIEELKNLIEKHYNDYCVTDLKLQNYRDQDIDLNDSTRTLSYFDVQPDETIYASLHLTSSGNRLPRLNSNGDTAIKSSSIIAKDQSTDVKVVCEISTFETNNTIVSVNDTVAELMKKIEPFKRYRLATQFEMWCRSSYIDAEQPNRRLSDFGVQAGDTINVKPKMEIPRKYALETSHGSTSLKLDISSPVGLYNIGNTCYMNSALQCLAHAKPLTEFFLDTLKQDASENDKFIDNDWNQFYTIGSVTGAYADLLKHLWLPNKTMYYSTSFRPTHIKETIGLQAPRFATYEQQDAQEFMTYLLDEIHKELKDKKDNDSNTIIEELFFGKLQSTITCSVCQHQVKTINPISFLPLPLNQQGCIFSIKFIAKDGDQDIAIVTVPENGRVKSIIEAYANSQPLRFFWRSIIVMTDDEQLDLEMSLDQVHVREVMLIEEDNILPGLSPYQSDRYSKKLTLQECLQEFCSVEILEDSWSCEQDTCKKKTNATKQLQLCTLPTILIIQFKRFSQENDLRHKIDTFVDYPIKGLNLSSFLSSEEEVAIYDLFAVCNHNGSIHGGHYIAYARHEANGIDKWHKFDDSYVSSFFSESDVVSKDAYLLFYIKRDKTKQSTVVTTS